MKHGTTGTFFAGMRKAHFFLVLVLHAAAATAMSAAAGDEARGVPPTPEVGSAIFIHPDGSSLSAWGAARLIAVGPDGEMNWDRLERIGIYRGHLTNSLGASSHGGATAHAFGVKVLYDSYGMNGSEPLTALSGAPHSIMVEARRAGLRTGLVNSGHIAEPGTGAFVASGPDREDTDGLTVAIIESGTDIILGGGETLLLPERVVGRHGERGRRRDGLNLVERAQALGYTIVYNREELLALPESVEKVLGLFAANNTFNDRADKQLTENNLPTYVPQSPTVAEMTAFAIRRLTGSGDRFLLVVEEEGSDNFANLNNARGTLDALIRADEAIGVALRFTEEHPKTLLLTAADSDAGGMQVLPAIESLPARTERRIARVLDWVRGEAETITPQLFVAKADQFGNRLEFAIEWATRFDSLGGIVARAHGLNADLLPASVDNTDIYRMLYATLFGRWLP